MKKNISEFILLTGAGFTKNFGGFLASEMWSEIFNHSQVQTHQQLRELLLNDFDYESIYFKIISGQYNVEEKKAISKAVFDSYRELDDIVIKWVFRTDAPYPVNIYGVNKLIELFAEGRDKLSFFFTLNQDLFIERYFNSNNKIIVHPGVAKIPDAHKIISKLPLNENDFLILPGKMELENHQVNQLSNNTLHYVKLHGSYGWKSHTMDNGYVIGRKKESQIAEEPLLSWYFDLFKNVLYQEKRKLLVIGYGFRDEHINKVIANSIEKYGLNLYIVSPSEPDKFFNELNNVIYGKKLVSGLSGFFPNKLLEIFPTDQSETSKWLKLKEIFTL